MLPSELVNLSVLGPSLSLPLNFYTESFLHHHTPNYYHPTTPPPHTHILPPALCASVLPDAWALRTLNISALALTEAQRYPVPMLLMLTEVGHVFFSMCHWTLKQIVQDVLWLPRIPGDIIIPSHSFLSSTPQPLASPSPPLGLNVPLSMEYSLYFIACHWLWFRRSCQDWLKRTVHLQTPQWTGYPEREQLMLS